MKKILILFFVLVSAISCQAQTPAELAAKNQNIDSSKVLQPAEYQARLNQIIAYLMRTHHFSKTSLDGKIASTILDDYLEALDHYKLYFYASDIEKFNKYRANFVTYLNEGNLEPAFEIFNVYKKRLAERIAFIQKSLKTEYDFTKDEYLIVDKESIPWAETEKEVNESWRLRLKNEMLNMIISGKDWDAAAKVLQKRYENYHRIILQYDETDVFQLYINSLTDRYDPHSNYLAPKAYESFNIQMKLSLEGIGAELTTENEYIKVARLIPGGPAFKSGLIKAGDKITAVAQGNDGELIDIIGWRLDDAVQLIRGKKGTKVRLSIIKNSEGMSAIPQEIAIIRDKVKLEEQAAQKETLHINENGRNLTIGVIKLPKFYIDFEEQRKGNPNYKSTTRDVKRILTEFNKEKVDGVILDLRNNGGGSLQEAVELVGLFIKDGPVVQVKTSRGDIDVNNDPDPSIIYDGPLGVIINRFSASASEIFAGAIQDYGRGIVIGETSYGKGTVQNLIELDRFLPAGRDKAGELKLTIGKFYRITGSSTQNLGVVPDIPFPSAFPADEFGESSQPTALPWDQINETKYNKYKNISSIIPQLLKKHEDRIKEDIEFQFLNEDILEYQEYKNRKEISLNLEKRKEERRISEEKKKLREEIRKKSSTVKIKGTQEVEKPSSEIEDFELRESSRILADFIASVS